MRQAAKLALALVTALAASASFADLLDFDSVCTSPPCLIDNRYPGYVFTPNTLQIVESGTDGLTGPVGGRYLAAPANINPSITGPRDITSITVRVARTSASSGPTTVLFLALKGSTPLLIPFFQIPLNGVNEWATFTFNAGGPLIADGFHLISTEPIGIDGIEFLTRCHGFTDVQPTDSYCDAVEWVANRGVTLGCGAGLYCPAATPTRAQMASFMQRLGDAVAPSVPRAECLRTSTFATVQRSCPVSVDVKPYPRVATATVSCGVVSSAQTTKVISSDIVVSDDDSTTWSPVGPTTFAVMPNADRSSVSQTMALDLSAGKPYLFAHELLHNGGDAAQAVTADCALVVTVGSRTGTATPF